MKRGEDSRCGTNTPWIPGDNIVVSTTQTAYELAKSDDVFDAGSARTTCATSEWRSLSGK